MTSHVDVKEVTVSPAKAALLIKRNAALTEADDTAQRNRRLKKDVVARLAADMKEGRWQFNGETIKLSSEGRILDGQHRLTACVQSDTPFRTLLVEGIKDETFKSIDVGSIRTGGDLMYIDGHTNTSNLSVACGILWKWEQGNHRGFAEWGRTPSKVVLFEVLDRHPKIEEFVSKTHGMQKLMSASLAAVCWYLFAKQDEALSNLFFDSLSTGLNLKQDDPVYILRERLIKDRSLKPRPQMSQTADLVIRTWNATRKGDKLTKLQRPRTDTQPGKKGSQYKLAAR